MEFLKSLGEATRKKLLIVLAISSLIILFIVTPVMQHYSELSGNPNKHQSRQFSFDPQILRLDYQYMLDFGNITAFKTTTLLDFGFMTCYGVLGFSSSLLIARKLKENTKWSEIGYLMALTAPIAAMLDCIENIFVLLTLTDPLNFPAWWAYAHFIAAIPKWLLLFVLIGWVFIALIYLMAVKIQQKQG